jgi:hypothetical protein
MHLVTRYAVRQQTLLAGILMALLFSCDDAGQLRVYSDASFVETINLAGDPTGGSGDAGRIEGCAIPEPLNCSSTPSGTGCCEDGERCVPTLGGDNRCEAAGEALDGEACGAGAECSAGLLCAESATGTFVCVRPCNASSAPCPTGQSCNGSLQVVGRVLTICTSS